MYGSVNIAAKSGNTFNGLSFHSARWYPNQDSVNPDTLPGGQSGSSVTGSGVNLGNITPGWSSQGYLVVRFTVNGTSGIDPAPTVSLSATPSSVFEGDKTTLQWSSQYANSCTALSGSGFSTGGATSGSDVSSSLYSPTSFSIRCDGNGGSATKSIWVSVKTPIHNPPVANTKSASNITTNSATLKGEVNPNGSATSYWFEWGNSYSLGNTTVHQSVGSGNSFDNVSRNLSGLSDNTTYYFRVVAQNAHGTDHGSILSFKTDDIYIPPQGDKPDANTKSASNITTSSAILNGEINPNGSTTSYWFEWGHTSNLGYTTSHQSAGYGNSLNSVSRNLSGLSNDTRYYFRVVAQNSYGIDRGATLSFKTNDIYVPPQGDKPDVRTKDASGIGETFAVLNGEVNANGYGTSYWFEWGTTGSLGNTTGHQSAGSGNSYNNISLNLSGLSDDTTYYFRAVAQNSYGTDYGSILNFKTDDTYVPPQGDKPIVQTKTASGIGQTSATLNGEVNPNGSGTSYWFEWGTTGSLGNTTGHQSAGSGNSLNNASYNLFGLSDNTTYYFRIVAQNTYGTTSGSISSFTTQNVSPPNSAPSATTQSATNVTETGAQLNGEINPNGDATSYWFEWGTTNNLGSTTGHQSAGSGDNSNNVSYNISGLSDNTTYYFRVVAQNANGTTSGSILSFTTQDGTQPSSAPSVTTQLATNIIQTAAQLNGNVNPNSAATSYWFKWGTTSSLGNVTSVQNIGSGNQIVPGSVYIAGLSANTTYYFQVVAQNTHGTTHGSILSFTTQNSGGGGTIPVIQTQAATNVSKNAARFNGQVNPSGSGTSYWFEWGTTISLGNSTSMQGAGGGSTAVNGTYNIFGLSENTTYYYRIAASNQHGTAQGSIVSFTTSTSGGGGNSPYVQTTSASSISEHSATLNGSVDPNGSATSYWFEWGDTGSLNNTTSLRSAGSGSNSINGSYTITGLNDNDTYYYRIVAHNQYGTSYGSVVSFTTDFNNNDDDEREPYARTTSVDDIDEDSARLRGEVDANRNSTYAWFEYGTHSNMLRFTTNTVYVGTSDYSKTVYQRVYNLEEGTRYYYRVVARNDYGTDYGSIYSFTTDGQSDADDAPFVQTRPASFVSNTAAIVNGSVDPNGGSTSTWFEWGLTPSLGFTTVSQSMGSGNVSLNTSAAVTSLVPNVTYYFRVVARNAQGTRYGSILNFITTRTYIPPVPPLPPGPPVPPQPPVIIDEGLSCIMLVPALNVSELDPGEEFVFTVTYRNGCRYNLSNTFMKVILPTDVEFVSTNYPFFNRDANGISYNLGVVSPGMQSAISISGVVSNNLQEGDTIIFSTVLNFNDDEGDFQSVSAYLSAVIGVGNTLMANVLSAFGNLFGNWLFILLLILVIAFLVWWIFFKEEKEDVDPLQEEEHQKRFAQRI